MIISFGWTTPALLSGNKTVTRRDWNPKHAAKFKAGMLVDAWNTSPRNVKGSPHKVAVIRLTADPVLEETCFVPPADWYAEGFEYMTQKGLRIDGVDTITWWDMWHLTPGLHLYVVRFEVVEYLEGPLQQLEARPELLQDGAQAVGT